MVEPQRVEAFPWTTLPVVTRSSLRRERLVRTAALSALPALESHLKALLDPLATLRLQSVSCVRPAWEAHEPFRLTLRAPHATLRLAVDPQLAARVTARLLNREVQLLREGHLDPNLAGVWAALVVELCRRSGITGLQLSAHEADAGGALAAVHAQGWATLSGRSYALACAVDLHAELEALRRPRPLREVGALPITLPFVAAFATLPAWQLQTLRVGDAWLPGAGWLFRGPNVGAGALAAASAEWGIAATASENGQLVLRGDRVALPLEATMPEPSSATPAAQRASSADLTEAVLEAPLVVRVELGAVTLSARQWAELAPGDVIETGQPLAGPVVLRVAGRDVARGELVNVDGELGVRILGFSNEGAV